ncbi:hypothetical protein ACP4OV_011508 [Aristida adscensionis]
MVRLLSSDGQEMEMLEQAIVAASETIRAIITEEGHATGAIPLPDVTAATLSLVVDHVHRHFDVDDDLDFGFLPTDPYNYEPLLRIENSALVDLILGARYLGVESLVILGCKAVAEQMRGKTIEEIRELFQIVNDYTKEEEEEVRRENAWAFE